MCIHYETRDTGKMKMTPELSWDELADVLADLLIDGDKIVKITGDKDEESNS